MTFSKEGTLRRWLLSAAIVPIALIAAACASSGGAGSPTDGPSSTESTSNGSTPPPTGSDTTGPTTTPAVSKCLASQLQLSVGGSQGAAGTSYTTYVVVNTGATPCTFFGYPGVSYLDSSGAEVGPAATRTTTPAATTFEVRPGDSAHFVVGNSTVIPQTGCPAPVTAPTLRMYPPDDTGALTVTAAGAGFQVCNPNVGPMTPGASE